MLSSGCDAESEDFFTDDFFFAFFCGKFDSSTMADKEEEKLPLFPNLDESSIGTSSSSLLLSSKKKLFVEVRRDEESVSGARRRLFAAVAPAPPGIDEFADEGNFGFG